MSKYGEVVKRFGRKPEVNVFSPTECRVCIPFWMVHNGAGTSRPFADGRTLEHACAQLLKFVDDPASWCHEGDCDYTCDATYQGMKDKQKASSKRLWSVVEEAAKTVETWPAWKRGLPPCEDPDCEREAEHVGKHRRAKPVEFEEWE